MDTKTRLTALVMALMISLPAVFFCGCAPAGAEPSTEPEAEAAAQLDKELGAFEITAMQRDAAQNNTAGYPVLDAGRGNPNWINAKVRYAFTRLMDFATAECERTLDNGDMAGHGVRDGIGSRFDAAMDPENEADRFLIDAVAYCVDELGMDKDDLLFELANGIIGDYYPSPSRCLTNTEVILNRYLESVLYNGISLVEETELFPTEGGSAAMSYIFQSLSHNKILKPGDKIAIGTPIFTPYLQIPNVNDYGLVSINVTAYQDDDWDIPEEELKKLENPEIKAFFLVNPSNPASHALSSQTLDRLAEVVEKNPDLIILTDDVYGTFVKDFQTVYSRIPYNTILVYSFSKLYGVTGWRTGIVALNRDNVIDRLIAELSEADKADLREQYAIVTEDPDSMKFIERLTADSRSIGLYHTSGLSTPSQVFMDLMALSHLACGEQDAYIELANQTVAERYDALMEALGMEPDHTSANAEYYALIDVNALITKRYGDDVTEWKKANISNLDFLNDLASVEGVVLMYGPGFDAPEGSVRISLANLNKENYVEIARRIMELLDTYYAECLGEQEAAA